MTTAKEKGVYVELLPEGYFIQGKWQLLVLDEFGLQVLNDKRSSRDEVFSGEVRPSGVWEIVNGFRVTFIFGVNSQLTIDLEEDSYFR